MAAGVAGYRPDGGINIVLSEAEYCGNIIDVRHSAPQNPPTPWSTFEGPEIGEDVSLSKQNPVHGQPPTTTFPKLPTRKDIIMHERKTIVGNFIYPKSMYRGYKPPLPVSEESAAIQILLRAFRHEKSFMGPFEQGSYTEFELSDFVVYLPPKGTGKPGQEPTNKHNPSEMRGLQYLVTKRGYSNYFFDGILSVGNERCYVEKVPFTIVSIGNYGASFHDVGTNIWIESNINKKKNIYYRLTRPAPEYERYHEGFIWLANFAKHFVDYALASEHPISIHAFRSDFDKWTRSKHQESLDFHRWYEKHGRSDFRRAVAVNIEFLFKESMGVDDPALRPQPIWRELMDKNEIPKQPLVESKTIVTPYVFECFHHMKFGYHLRPVDPTIALESCRKLQDAVIRRGGSPSNKGLAKARSNEKTVRIPKIVVGVTRDRMIASIKLGDVVAIPKDVERTSRWKEEASRFRSANNEEGWYLCVTAIQLLPTGKRAFHGIFLSSPCHTTCGLMKYPFSNELFLSNICTCKQAPYYEDEIHGILDVVWHGDPTATRNKFVVRQACLDNENFVTLQEAHKTCQHRGEAERPQKFLVGQTVLVPPRFKSAYALEAYEVVQFSTVDNKDFVTLRQLRRRQQIDGRGRPNELVYTERLEVHRVNKIERPCLVRIYTEQDVEARTIPAPYCRDGTGNAFYITSRLVQENGLERLEAIQIPPKSLLQGFDPLATPNRRPLRGLDLYCGGGNYGRGFEETGAVHNEWAVDIDENAIHTYNANLKKAGNTKLFFGSVNDMLKQAMEDNPKNSDLIPLPGDVDFISAGSPCQGFSILNSHRDNDKGLRNQSLVSSVAAYIDFYRPKYGVLENVLTMAQKGTGRAEDILSQLICAIVGMGYQVQLFLMDAWSYGSPQGRSRLFVSFAAPGLALLEHPALSHSHPPDRRSRALGVLANGEAFGHRQFDLTPFKFVDAKQATEDLPKLIDGATLHCTSQPDHVIGTGMSKLLRQQIQLIPKYPRGMNFVEARNSGRLTAQEIALFPRECGDGGAPSERASKKSKACQRVKPHELFHTITTVLTVMDARAGGTVHWSEDRPLTTMEAKRAQGFPDDEVLIGAPKDGWKILGNSVARTISLALGLSLREAWLKNEPDKSPEAAAISRSILQVVIPFKPMPLDSILSFEDEEDIAGSQVVLGEIYSDNDDETPRMPNESTQTVTTSRVEPITLNGNYKSTESRHINHTSSARVLTSREGITGQTKYSLPTNLPPSTLVSQKPEHQLLAHKTFKRSRVSSITSLSSTSTYQANQNVTVTSSKRQKTGSYRAPSSLPRPAQHFNGYTDSSIDETGLSEDVPNKNFNSLAKPLAKSRLGQITTNGRGHMSGHVLITSPDSSSNNTGTISDASDSRARVSALLSRRAWTSYSQQSNETNSGNLPTNPITNGQKAVGTSSVLQMKDKPRQSVVSLNDVLDDEPFMSAASSSASSTSRKSKESKLGNVIPNGGAPVIPKKPTVINLLSDDESEDELMKDISVVQTAKRQTVKYVPVDNSAFGPYAATHQYLNFDRQRKHGPRN